VNTAVTIADTISSTVLWLAGIGAGLKLALTVAPRFQIAAPKAPQVRVKIEPEAQAPKVPAADAKTGPVPRDRAS
jgi:hypothetical protein